MVMQRAIVRLDTPLIHPHTCIFCGVGGGPYRLWFVDLGIDINAVYQAVREGSVYVCNECLPGFVDSLLKIIADWRDEVMDNTLMKEEPSYGLVDGIAGGSELSDLRSGESEHPVSGSGRDLLDLQVMDFQESVPDTGDRARTETNLGVIASPESDNPGVEPAVPTGPKIVPSFRMGKRTN